MLGLLPPVRRAQLAHPTSCQVCERMHSYTRLRMLVYFKLRRMLALAHVGALSFAQLRRMLAAGGAVDAQVGRILSPGFYTALHSHCFAQFHMRSVLVLFRSILLCV